jgi:hypothetical protein
MLKYTLILRIMLKYKLNIACYTTDYKNTFVVSTHTISHTCAAVQLNAVKYFHNTFVGIGYMQCRTATNCSVKAAVFQVQ